LRYPVSLTGMVLLAVVLAMADWPPLVRNRLFELVEDGVSTLVTEWFTPINPLDTGLLTHRARLAPRGPVMAFGPRELVRRCLAGESPPKAGFLVLANTPGEYQWISPEYRRWLLEASTEAAIAWGVDAVVDASAADGLRTTGGGRETARRLRQAGILRAVILDGGHHLPALALQPDLAILPVLHVQGTDYACHVRLRDAVPWPALARLVRIAGLRTAFYTTPRLLTMAKTRNAMAVLLVKVLSSREHALLQQAARNGPARAGAARILPGHDAEDAAGPWQRSSISVPLSAVDLILAEIASFWHHAVRLPARPGGGGD